MTTPAPEEVARVRWWVAGLTLLGGLIIGVVVTAVLVGTTPEFGASSDRSASAEPSNDQRVDNPVPVTAQARVNAACLRVINEAQDVYRILSNADEAARDVDFQQLDDIVRRLQPVQSRLERDLAECRVDTSVNATPTTTPNAPVPTVPQPTTGSPR